MIDLLNSLATFVSQDLEGTEDFRVTSAVPIFEGQITKGIGSFFMWISLLEEGRNIFSNHLKLRCLHVKFMYVQHQIHGKCHHFAR